MSRKPVVYFVMTILVTASLFLSSCGGAKTTPVATQRSRPIPGANPAAGRNQTTDRRKESCDPDLHPGIR